MNAKRKASNEMNRRSFLKGAAGAAAVTTAGLIAGCGPKQTAAPAPEGEAAVGGVAASQPSFLNPPAPIDPKDIKETVSTDVVVVGAGISGLMAAFTAAEAGAKTILIEKDATFMAHGGHNAALRSKLQLEEGLDYDPGKVARELIRWSGNKVDSSLVMLWATQCSGIMDMLIDMAGKEGLEVSRWGNDIPGEYFPEYKTVHMFGGMNQANLAQMLQKNAEANGAEVRFSTPAVQLVREDKGRVTGVIAKNEAGEYLQFNAAKGVILCTGDYASDPEMIQHYCPKAANVDGLVYTRPVNTGDGHKMGLWVGAKMQEEEPHTPMIHNLFGAPFSGNPFLRVNLLGERYENEDVPIPSMANSIQLQPERKTWTVYDASFAEDLPKMGVSFSRTNMMSEFTQTSIDNALKEGKNLFKADTLDELAQKMGVPAEAFKATVARYNELAEKGRDDDFGKNAEMLTPIDTAPFYAAYNPTMLLVVLGGLKINTKMQVLDSGNQVIPGLYAAGNASGGFFANDYPVIVPGLSHSRAWTFGRLAGLSAAEG